MKTVSKIYVTIKRVKTFTGSYNLFSIEKSLKMSLYDIALPHTQRATKVLNRIRL